MTPVQLYNEFISGKTLDELAKIQGVSKARIGQILKPHRHNIDLRLDRPAKEVKQLHNFKWKHRKQRSIFYTRRKQAQKEGIEWTIVPTDLDWVEVCPVLGLTLNYEQSVGRTENSPSLDRIDCTKGYIPSNVAIISWRANRIKNNGTIADHKAILDWMLSCCSLEV